MKSGSNMIRNAVSLIGGFVVLWYVGAMFDFFPFLGDDFAVRAIGFTGLLICAILVICTCWVIGEIKKK